jgi:iron complex transport system ATP-binding protein
VSDLPAIALQTTDLVVGYKKETETIQLFESLSLELRSGELVCFMGSNGIGKTTLIKTLAGIHKPLDGKIHRTQEAALVLTDRINSALMTVRDLVTYGRYPYLDWNLSLTLRDSQIIDAAIQQVRLEHIIDKRLVELSDGQIQMAMIAKALAQDTTVLLLDEPTAHLDLNNRVEIMNLLRSLSRNAGKTILVATHELDLALQTADRIWLATSDKKIVEGIPEDLVLNGTFDDVFQFKGFDLKTGKMTHTPYRNISVQLTGSGYEYLWTKNALERSGYEFRQEAPIRINVRALDNGFVWTLFMDSKEFTYSAVSQLLKKLSD